MFEPLPQIIRYNEVDDEAADFVFIDSKFGARMANIFKKLWNIFSGKTVGGFDRPENPEEEILKIINELGERLKSVQKAIASALMDEKYLKTEYGEMLTTAGEWEKKAILALDRNDEVLAKESLLKQEEYKLRAAKIQKKWEAQKKETDHLKDSLNKIRQQAEDEKRKYTLLLARYRSAETRKHLAETQSSSHAGSALKIMEQLDDQIIRMEAEAEVYLMDEIGYEDMENEILERKKKEINAADLSELKAKIFKK